MMWLIAIAAWIVTSLLISHLRRSSPGRWFAIMPARRYWRILGRVWITLLWVVALVLIVMLVVRPLAPNDLSRSDALAAILVAIAVLTYFQNLLAHVDIVLTEEGIALPHLFVPWSDINNVRLRETTLEITTPKLPRYWNGWTGRLVLYRLVWDMKDDVLEGMQERIRTHKGP